MKQNIKRLAIVLLLSVAAFLSPKQSSAQQNDVNFQVFYDALSPYGQWVDYKSYGYVWIPDVGTDFVPYSTSGYWTLTDYGWTWVSDYDWGWAPFHYGRWDYDNYYGWLWVPDNEWGPSWVNWRRADGYYGWSPMQPGISVSLSFGQQYNSSNDHWMFVRDRDFERHDIYRYSVNRSDHATIIKNSTVINTTYIDNSRHTTYVTGPSRNEVQRVTGRTINPVPIRDNNRPGKDINDGNLKMYRPQVMKNNRPDNKPVPVKVENIKDVHRPSERKGTLQPSEMNQKTRNDPRPSQPQQVTPAGTKQKQQQQNTTPQKTNLQPQQQHQTTPAGNKQRQQQQNVTPQKTNTQPPQKHQATPASKGQKQQPPITAPQKNKLQPQPAKQQPHSTIPAANIPRQSQQNATPMKPLTQPRPAQQQHAAPLNRSQQPQNAEKQQNQKKEEQQK